MGKYKCPFCGKEYDEVGKVIGCVNTCGAKIKQEDNAKKVNEAKEKVNKIYEELKKAIEEYNKIAENTEFYSHLGCRSKETIKLNPYSRKIEKNKDEENNKEKLNDIYNSIKSDNDIDWSNLLDLDKIADYANKIVENLKDKDNKDYYGDLWKILFE